MLKLTNFVTRPIAVATMAALFAVCLLPSVSPATLISDGGTFDDTSQVAFAVSDTDLVNDDNAAFSSLTSSPVGLTFGNVANLNEGTAGTGGIIGTTAAHADAIWSVTFTLNRL